MLAGDEYAEMWVARGAFDVGFEFARVKARKPVCRGRIKVPKVVG